MRCVALVTEPGTGIRDLPVFEAADVAAAIAHVRAAAPTLTKYEIIKVTAEMDLEGEFDPETDESELLAEGS